MTRATRAASLMVGVLALYTASCVDPQEVSELKSEVEEVQAQQKDILAKLDGLAKGQKDILAKAPAAAPAAAKRPPAEDPNKVHDIEIGDSFSKGAEDASVVLVEWSDFQ